MLRPYQQAAHDAAINWIKRSIEPAIIEAETGCHKKGYKILMADGSTKNVECISIGDHVMGLNGVPRKVIDLHNGYDHMFEINPINGEPYIVNGGHILNLYKTRARKGDSISYTNISVYDFLKKDKRFKHLHKLHRSKIDFVSKDISIDPWTLGFLIGDGCLTGTPGVTICDLDYYLIDEIKLKLKCFDIAPKRIQFHKTGCKQYSLKGIGTSRSVRNKLTVELEKLGINVSAEFKFVPDIYKFNSCDVRNNILSGLLDSDGHYDKKTFDWISKSRVLADDVVFLARSLGLKAQVSECIKSCQNNFSGKFYRVCISGNLEILNIRSIRRKPGARKQIKNPLVTGFSVRHIGFGEYFGFSIDGDNLYLGHDFIVHHNSGKSHVIAAIAKSFYELSGKHVLCTAPSAELVQQNTDKFLLTGEKASIFSASIGKSLRYPIVFGTPISIKNSINKFSDKFGLICIDEAHGITPTIKSIIDTMRDRNPMLRVLGLSATPYRLGTGLIYAIDENDNPSSPEECRDPYFKKKLFTIGGRELIEQGYLTQPIIGAIHGDHYDTLNMQLNSMGKFNANDIDRAYHGQGRKTSRIIADIVNQAKNRKGVMIFAATVKHAYECIESLPKELSAIVTGDTPKHERANILARFKRRELKYLVNVSVLSVGFDAPHVDLIALLRATESIGLMKQIVGRGLRIYEGKKDCLILDYAENIDRHCPDHDIFNPKIKAYNSPGGGEQIKAICELCKTENTFTSRKNEDNLKWDEHGYFVDLDGNRIESEYGAMPAHYGRRCLGLHLQRNGKYEQCDYRWTFKNCPECNAENDIAARYCSSCRSEIINPNDKLIAEFRARKRDPYQIQCDKVLSWNQIKTLSQSGNEVLKIEYTTEYRSFTVWHQIKSGNAFFIKQYEKFLIATQGGDIIPESITYKKNAKTGFFEVLSYNQEVDKLEVA